MSARTEAFVLLDSLEEAPRNNRKPPPAAHLRQPRYGPLDYDDLAPIDETESVFRHSGWAPKRRRIRDSLQRTGASGRRILNFCDCGSDLWVKRDGKELVLTRNRCHDRLCDPCQAERRCGVIEQIMLRILDTPNPCQFITLTLRHQRAPLAVQIDRLLSSFKLLRQHPEMAAFKQGGVWFFEAKLDENNDLWHPHLHLILAADSITHLSLSKAWHQVTGDSFIVDVQRVEGPKGAARYVTKYATKPLHSAVARHPEKLDEFVTAIKGRRLFQCFGNWTSAQTKAAPSKRKLERVGALCTIHADALAGDVQSLVLMHQLHAKWPRLRASHPLPPELAPRDAPPPTTSP